MSGPAPKRSEERRRTNTPAAGDPRILDVSQIVAEDRDSLPFKIKQPVEPPARGTAQVGYDSWEPQVQQLWDSFERSGTALYWEPSDWAFATLFCETISRELAEQFVGYTESGEMKYATIPIKGGSLAAISRMASQLMLTESDRRRAGLEIKRDRFGAQPLAEVVSAADRKKALRGG